ncbi:MAG: hypothetical protein NVSMB42_19140 [Herpetosiphon sp.]
MDLQAAITFVATRGTALDKERLAGITERQRQQGLPAALEAARNQDGGWALGLVAGQPSALHTTVLALEALIDIGAAREVVQPGLTFLQGRHQPRGVWREVQELKAFSLPPWADPELPAADVYTTALCAGALVAAGGSTLAVDRAVVWLQTQQGRDGLLPGWKLHSSWLALPAFAQSLGIDSRATRRLYGGLSNGLSDEWTGGMIVGCLEAVLQASYDDTGTLTQQLMSMLATKQDATGGFEAGEDEQPVDVTLQAVRVLTRLEREQRL